MLAIDLTTARRFILGKQGLWPGRRWRGAEGVAQAMRAIGYLQLDPLQVVARSHDITLHSRVFDYTPGQAVMSRRKHPRMTPGARSKSQSLGRRCGARDAASSQ